MSEPMCQDCWHYPVREGEKLCPACAANREIRPEEER